VSAPVERKYETSIVVGSSQPWQDHDVLISSGSDYFRIFFGGVNRCRKRGRRKTLVVVAIIIIIDRIRSAVGAEKTHWIRIEETTELLSFREIDPIIRLIHFLLWSVLCPFLSALGGIVPRFTATVLSPLSSVFAFGTVQTAKLLSGFWKALEKWREESPKKWRENLNGLKKLWRRPIQIMTMTYICTTTSDEVRENDTRHTTPPWSLSIRHRVTSDQHLAGWLWCFEEQ
jgi:hypothetical protein